MAYPLNILRAFKIRSGLFYRDHAVWPLFVGLLLALSAAIYFWGTPSAERYLQHELIQLQHQVSTLRKTLDANAARGVANVGLQQIAVTSDKFPNVLQDMFAEATLQGIALPRADYQHVTETLGGVRRVEVTFPLRTVAYVQAKQFVLGVLKRNPAIALTEFSIKREQIGTALVDAKIRFTVYLREGS